MAKGDDDILAEAKEAFDEAHSAWDDNKRDAIDDVRFARLEEQWPEPVRKQREIDKRPCLTINKLPAFIRQVVNDSRQNKPSIAVHPVDSGADKKTAEIMSGIIRNIEYTSNADVAYDTAVECAVTGGYGFIRVGMDYAHDDTFDMDITIDRVANPFAITPDPYSTAADSSDWNVAFAEELISKDEFARKYKGAAKVDWGGDSYGGLSNPWMEGDDILVAEYWTREEIERTICLYSDGSVHAKEDISPEIEFLIEQGIIQKTQERKAKSWKVMQRILTGAEVLEENEWQGRFIPIIPVYGDEINLDGKRYFRSLVRGAKDAQRMFNYWRSTATELGALAPRVPFIGPKGAFKTDADKWATVNTHSWPYIEYDIGAAPPQRQDLNFGVAAGALQEALNASDDMKAILGIYDASLGARSNETSGKAIMARQREGDISTFHFADNMSRAIRHAGRILIDLIPQVYDKERVVRVIGEDGSQEQVPLKQPVQETDRDGKPVMGPDGNPITRIYDLRAGKYDLTVKAGPSFTTRREEAATQMTEMVRGNPDLFAVAGDLIAKNLDWPGADELAERLKKVNPALKGDGIPPEIQQQMTEAKEAFGKLQQENQQLKVQTQKAEVDKTIEGMRVEIDGAKLQIDQFRAETERVKTLAEIARSQNGTGEEGGGSGLSMGQISALMEQNGGSLSMPDIEEALRPQPSKTDIAMQDIAGQLAQLSQVMMASLEEQNAPVELIRGPDGQAAGVRKGGRDRLIVRGPDGRPVGLQ